MLLKFTKQLVLKNECKQKVFFSHNMQKNLDQQNHETAKTKFLRFHGANCMSTLTSMGFTVNSSSLMS